MSKTFNIWKIYPTEEQFKTEEQLSKGCFNWFDKKYGEELRGALYLNFMNPKDAKETNRLKAQGLRKGLPDMTLALPLFARRLAGLYIELKLSEGGKVSADQTKQMRKLDSLGYCCEIVCSLKHFQELVEAWVEEFDFDNL
tara:strand:+ start:198 stop:620 length:423 start_codon:yes stop_codon:yes gene_type:complete